MRQNTHFSPISPHQTVFIDSSTESDTASSVHWSGPENQLGLLQYQLGLEQDDQVDDNIK